MKETFRLVVVLTVICLLAGLMLAWVNGVTRDRIRQAERAEKMSAIKKVLPECDNDPDSDAVVVESDGTEWTFFVGRKAGQFVGAAFETVSAEGYGGDINVMVGVSADDKVFAIEILKAKETPGLGAKIADDAFRHQFAGRPIADSETVWKVKKDQGDLDHITAATISSRAVVSAVKNGLDVYLTNKVRIQGPAE